MTAATLNDTLVLGALTGMRSLAGPTALALPEGGMISRVATMLAAGEMAADKTSLVGDRIDAIPLAGRAAMGALVGGVIARQDDGNIWLGGLLGAAAAVAMAHIAFHLRKRLPMSSAMGGMLEDAIVLGVGAQYARRRRGR